VDLLPTRSLERLLTTRTIADDSMRSPQSGQLKAQSFKLQTIPGSRTKYSLTTVYHRSWSSPRWMLCRSAIPSNVDRYYARRRSMMVTVKFRRDLQTVRPHQVYDGIEVPSPRAGLVFSILKDMSTTSHYSFLLPTIATHHGLNMILEL